MHLDHARIAEARRTAGLLLDDVGHAMGRERSWAERLEVDLGPSHLTLAQVTEVAGLFGIPANQILQESVDQEESPQDLGAAIAAAVVRPGSCPTSELSLRLDVSAQQIREAAETYNNRGRSGLRLCVDGDTVRVLPDREARSRFSEPRNEALVVDVVLYAVLDRKLPDSPPADLSDALADLAGVGLIAERSGTWHPTDDVITAMELVAWEPLAVHAAADGWHEPLDLMLEELGDR